MSTENMPVRELVEFAAKAAGMRGAWDSFKGRFRLYIGNADMFLGDPWEPESDDGESRRLTAKLGITIAFINGRAHAKAKGTREWTVPYVISKDSCAAAREAALRVAADIGQGIDTMETFCIGIGCMTKCDTCQHRVNWEMLNQMDDALRKPMQAKMMRIDTTSCQISSGCNYKAIVQKGGVE